jgi:hypothetical protein
MIPTDSAGERAKKTSEAVALREARSYEEAARVCLRHDPNLTESQALERAAKARPDLYLASQRAETVTLMGPRSDDRGTWADTDRYGRVHLSDLTREDVAEEVRLLTNGPLVGTGRRKKGNGSISDSIDPKQTGNVREFEDDQPDEDDYDPYAEPDDEITRLAEADVQKAGDKVDDFKARVAAVKSVRIRNPKLAKRWDEALKRAPSSGATKNRFRE